jgi:proline iminopeptidase
VRRAIHTPEVNLHYWRNEATRFDTWTLLEKIACRVLVLAGVDDPMCPIDLVDGLTASRAQLVRLDGARHAVFRDQPELAFSAVREFVAEIDKDRGLPET